MKEITLINKKTKNKVNQRENACHSTGWIDQIGGTLGGEVRGRP